MTTKKDNNENNENNENVSSNKTDADVKSEKTNKVAEKLKTMGVMPSDKKESETVGRRFSPLLITVLVAVPAAAAVAYYTMPEQFNNLLSSINISSPASAPITQPEFLNKPYVQPQVQEHPATGNAQANTWGQAQEPEWVTQQRAEMEKRRVEFQKQYASRNTSNTQPMQPPEPPQWVKDRQAEIEQQMAQYQQRGSHYPDNQTNYRAAQAPAYMQHPSMNPYNANPQFNPQTMQQQQPVNAPNPQGQQSQRPYYGPQNYPVNPYYYYNQPNYGPNPYNRPYGWNANPYNR
jgi:hypothetical protein